MKWKNEHNLLNEKISCVSEVELKKYTFNILIDTGTEIMLI